MKKSQLTKTVTEHFWNFIWIICLNNLISSYLISSKYRFLFYSFTCFRCPCVCVNDNFRRSILFYYYYTTSYTRELLFDNLNEVIDILSNYYPLKMFNLKKNANNESNEFLNYYCYSTPSDQIILTQVIQIMPDLFQVLLLCYCKALGLSIKYLIAVRFSLWNIDAQWHKELTPYSQ